MKVFVTGTEGYIGVLLAQKLMARGHDVVGLDTGYYRDGWLYSSSMDFPLLPALINKDLRHIEERDLEGFDAVIHLAELSNDPLSENNPEVTYKINHQGSVELAKKAKRQGIERFIYTSSCSVYGFSDHDFVTEESPTNPQTPYAVCKTLVERDVSALADDGFSPVFLRNATAYGPSPRMRFDIVLNNLAGWARTTGKIAMTSDGSPWRPVVHVLDICKAIICALEAPRESVHCQVFNVGNNEDNHQVKDLAGIIGQVFTGCEVTMGSSAGDNRSYRVSFDKINSLLPGFSCDWNARAGAESLYDTFERIRLDDALFRFRAYTRLLQLKYLQATGQIDGDFFWRY